MGTPTQCVNMFVWYILGEHHEKSEVRKLGYSVTALSSWVGKDTTKMANPIADSAAATVGTFKGIHLPPWGGTGLSPNFLRAAWVSILGYLIIVAIRFLLPIFFVAVLKYFRIHISQLSPFGAARISHFEVLTRVLDLGPSVAIFRAFYTRIYSDGLFSFAKRSLSAPSCLSKPPDSIKNWADHFFWVDSRVFPISVPLYTGGVLEKDPTPHLTARQEQAIQVLSSNKAPFRRYPECFFSSYMGLLDYIRTADPRKVQAIEVQKGEEQVTLLESIKHCLSPGAPCCGTTRRDPEGDLTVVEKGDAAQKQPEKAKRKKLSKQSDTLPAKRLRIDHPSLASGTGGSHLLSETASRMAPFIGLTPADVHTQVLQCGGTSRVADAPVYTAADIVTSSRDYDQLFEEFNVGAARQICLGSEGKDAEIARLKSLVKEKETESAEKDTDISLLDSRASYLKSALDDSQACVSTLHSAFRDFKEKMEAQQEAQAQELYNRVAELEAHVMDVSGRLEGEFYPAYLTALAGRRWLLTHGMELAMVKCLKSPEYQGILGHALGRAMDYGMQEGLAAGHEHGVAGTPLSAVVAYNPETAESNYLDAVRALEETDFSLVHLLKTLLSFALLNVHTRAEGAKRHASALRQLMVDIVSHPLSSQNLLGEASTSAVAPCVEDLDTDEDLGSVVCMPTRPYHNTFASAMFAIFCLLLVYVRNR
ncbi:hypothetical protein Tco_0607701 [Tanacetum coccineum]